MATLIEQWMPQSDTSASYATTSRASPEEVYAEMSKLDMTSSLFIRLLFAMRSLDFRWKHKHNSLGLTLDGLKRNGFIVLDENPPHELVLGLVGKFWTPSGSILRMTPDEFASFNTPAYAKAVWNLRVDRGSDGRSILSTETRIRCTNDASRRKFRRYWFIVKPFSGLIRKSMLRTIKRQAERQ